MIIIKSVMKKKLFIFHPFFSLLWPIDFYNSILQFITNYQLSLSQIHKKGKIFSIQIQIQKKIHHRLRMIMIIKKNGYSNGTKQKK